MLLSDLWAGGPGPAAKRDEGAAGMKPFLFIAFIDEFQDYVTPVMAETL